MVPFREVRLRLSRKHKRRKVFTTVFIACEGCREYQFLSYIKSVFSDDLDKNHIKLEIDDKRDYYGGSPEKRISRALKNVSKYDIVIAWLDNDKQINNSNINKDIKNSWCIDKIKKNISLIELKNLNVNNKNPLIILAEPLCIENVIIELLGKKTPKYKTNLSTEDNVKILKDSLSGIFGFKDIYKEFEYYKKHLTKEKILKKAVKINSLSELFQILNIQGVI